MRTCGFFPSEFEVKMESELRAWTVY
jgi:hypothetical protein